MKINKENDSVGAVPLTGNKTQRPLKPTNNNTDTSLQPPWTDDKEGASVQLTHMIDMTTKKPRRLWKPRPLWAIKEANHKDANDLQVALRAINAHNN